MVLDDWGIKRWMACKADIHQTMCVCVGKNSQPYMYSCG